jgi:2-[(L-alanin-3-ylcarbamoyl)methyl]-3-(2-aminoethylcarbamoyl)-2-hydroxypropanoate synthase
MALVHVDGKPERVVLKDFHDGVRFSREHLAKPAPELAGTPAHHQNRNSFVETDELSLVTDFLLDAFFFINLGELALFLADHYGFAEQDFWRVVVEEIRAYQRRFPELEARFELFDLFTPAIEVEQLTTRRLHPDTELRLHAVPNPLAEVERC